ncbi:MAG: hypothetical protein K5685_14640 [Bacteroidales bacterium]|nr:hypothetical protein [Bacteroidales bacterium]
MESLILPVPLSEVFAHTRTVKTSSEPSRRKYNKGIQNACIPILHTHSVYRCYAFDGT